MENSIFKVIFVEDTLFGLVINRTLPLAPDRVMSEEDREWFTSAINKADIEVREMISHLLNDSKCNCINEGCCNECSCLLEPLTYNIIRIESLHHKSIPMRIEEALIAIVYDRWCNEFNIDTPKIAADALNNLRKSSQRRNSKVSRVYNI